MSKDTKAAKATNLNPKIKFPIHDTHFRKSLSNLRIACVLALAAPLCFYLFHNVPRSMAYKNFYTHYDALDAFDRMQSGGYLSSCPKEDKGKKGKEKN